MHLRKAPFASVGLATCLALGCGKDATGLAASDFVGDWNVTKADFINPANPAQHLDLIAEGHVVTTSFTSIGRYSLTFTEPGAAPQTEVGDWFIQQDRFVWRGDVDPDALVRFTAEFGTGVVTLTTMDSEHDLDGDGQDEPTRLVLVLQRQ